MRRTRKLFVLGLAAMLSVALVVPPAAATQPVVPDDMGDLAYGYLVELDAAGARQASTPAETAAAETVMGWFTEAGYEPYLQPFSYGSEQARESQNVIAFKPSSRKVPVAKRPLVIVGAHYDSVYAAPTSTGADDNASGVSVMLEVAARLSDADLPYDLQFIAFGAEEVGLEGSKYFVRTMSKTDKERAIAMINFDSLIAGDYRYIHAGFNHKTWARDAMLEIIDELDLDIRMHDQPKYPAGLTPPGFSDYTAFNNAGIPIVAFEATNWSVGPLDGYWQLDPEQFIGTELEELELVEIWHTPYDYLAFIEDMPVSVGTIQPRPQQHLTAYTTLVYVFLRDLQP
ncbi:MAG: M20/M25/M40 family metallo-hydrolase [Coriobacteriia bacterium]|nr:M20/M25/M40 family metallo-hydrolase [Coriobacteriia bacterium]